MIGDLPVHTTIPASDLSRARAWYESILGVTPVQEAPGGTLYEMPGGGAFVLYPSPNAGQAPQTVMGFRTSDLEASVDELTAKGVTFEQYDYPTLKTNERGIAESPGPTRSAWFKDSEGNILGIVQLPPA